jgi:hypothetical protein
MKNIIISLLLFSFIYADDSEKQYWDEVKYSSDVELLKSYKKQYPHGIFEKIADIKIKRLQKIDTASQDKDVIPNWLKGTSEYKFYGVGKANKHFKGKHYQENLSRNRARRELQSLFEDNNLENETMNKYNTLIEEKKYVNKKGRIYILLYIDNYNI